MDILDVSKWLHIRIKRMGVIYTLIDKPTRTLVPALCKGVKPILHGLFLATLDSWERDKNCLQVKIWTKSARNLDFCTEYTLYISFPKILKCHALSADFLLTPAFSGRSFPKFYQNWTIFKLLYLGNKWR